MTKSTTVRFVDTNVLLYAVSRHASESRKAEIANTLLNDGDVALSAQVLQEFYAQATRESRRPGALTHQEAAGLVAAFARFPVQETTKGLVLAAIATRERFQVSYWDAAIIEAARVLGCEQVLSEDLSNGQSYDGVTVVNPFR